MARLPIDDVMPEIVAAVRGAGAAVVVAPPGAGKTTRVPPALLGAGIPEHGQVIVLEPRRVAARAAARRMAEEDGTPVGDRVGFHIRFDRVAGPRTRILVVTEGILTRRLQDDPFLEGVSAVVLDEFHERSLHADLALALVREVRSNARPDLKVVVMSATLDPVPVARFLGDAPVITAAGRSHPVEVGYLEEADERPVAERTAAGVRNALRSGGGDVLVFLPGAGEIARVADLLEATARERDLLVVPLHGDLPGDAQDLALRPAARRRVILATNVAETSLTIEGVSTVVDSGLVRRLRHDPDLGLDRLELRPVSKASADQRAGRAGRIGPGRAFRLWTRARQRELEDVEIPEIRRVDLAATVLELRAWGIRDAAAFEWFDPPAPADVRRAEDLLRRLGAVDNPGGGITATGRALLRLPLHPRLGRLIVEAHRRGVLGDGAVLAALCAERDVLREGRAFSGGGPAGETGPSDLLRRLDAFREAARRGFRAEACMPLGIDAGAARAVDRAAAQIARQAGAALGRERERAAGTEEDLLKTVLAGFPDRVARRRVTGSAKAVMTGGRGLELAPASVVRDAPLFVAVDVEAGRRGEGSVSRVRIASRVEEAWLEELFPGSVRREAAVRFDPATERVTGSERILYHDLVLEERPGLAVDPDLAARELEAALRADPAKVLRLEGDLGAFVTRVRCLRGWMPELGLPALDEADLVSALAELGPGCRSFEDLRRAPLLPLLRSRLTPVQTQALAREAPERWPLREGRSAALRYEEGRPPVLAAKVQHLFGILETPVVGGGRVRCQVELLGPNQRPVQVTQDLASFWRNTYSQVRKDLRGRYPKHAWPEIPPGLPGG